MRAAALRCLADITADQRGGVEGVVQQILSQVLVTVFSELLGQTLTTCKHFRRCLVEEMRQRGWQNFWMRCTKILLLSKLVFFFCQVATDLSAMNLLPSRHQLVLFIRRRALDQSVAVRRSALQVGEPF